MPDALRDSPAERMLVEEARRSMLCLSPGGNLLAYGVLSWSQCSIHVMDIRDGTDRVLFSSNGLVTDLNWFGDGRTLAFAVETSRSSTWCLMTVDVFEQNPIVRAEVAGSQTSIVSAAPGKTICFRWNPVDRHRMDLYSIEPTGYPTLVFENFASGKGLTLQDWVVDTALGRLVSASMVASDGRKSILWFQDKDLAPYVVRRYDAVDGFLSKPIAADTDLLYVIESNAPRRCRVVSFDNHGRCSDIYEDYRYDVDSVLLDRQGRPAIAQLQRLFPESIALTAEIQRRLHVARGNLRAPVRVRSFDDESNRIVFTSGDSGPEDVYIQEPHQQFPLRLFSTIPNFDTRPPVAHRSSVRLVPSSCDILDVFLTTPIGSPTGAPAVVVLHGGPTLRDNQSFRLESQWLADMGYVVVRVNFRGSSGYGPNFLTAADGAFGAAARDDVMRTVDTLVDDGTVSADRIAIMGWSLGGTLALLCAERSTSFRACVSILGILDVTRLITGTSPHRFDQLIRMAQQLGDPVLNPASLNDVSPLRRPPIAVSPTLLVVGERDRFAPPDDTRDWLAFDAPLRHQCESLVLPGEGHTVRSRKNRHAMLAAVGDFLRRWLD